MLRKLKFMPKNMELFNKAATLMLAKLFDEFPKPTHLKITEFEQKMSDEVGEIYSATLIFLRDEGFIRCDRITNRGLDARDVVLSSKGLAALNSTPKALKDKRSLGEKIKNVAHSGTKETFFYCDERIYWSCVY
jgi:hypothetical protein